MDIATQAEIILRKAGYDTWPWTGVSPAVTCFENAVLIGFVHAFASVADLLAHWETAQQAVLSRHSAALRRAGEKAWNVYSIFLTAEQASPRQSTIERIEEDFALTRKIARAAIRTTDDLESALLPLTAVRDQPMLTDANFEARLRTRLKDLPQDAITAFLGETRANEVARKLGAGS